MNIRYDRIKTELLLVIECIKGIETKTLDYNSDTKITQAVSILECLINLIDWES